jgi:hypothetical protein
MKLRPTAFALHLTGSAVMLTAVLGAFWLGWYRWPGWYLASALQVVGILVMVDVVLGPTLTLIVASPAKPRRVLARDIAIIVTVQLAALVYGATTLWLGRPLYYTFSVDQLELVQASDLQAVDIAAGRRENPTLAPFWYSRPRWIWAPLPQDPEEAARIVNGAVFGGSADVIQMPHYFRPWSQGLPQLRQHLQAVDQIKYFTRAQKQRLRAKLARRGLPADQADAIVMWGGTRRVLVVFDVATMQVRAILAAD